MKIKNTRKYNSRLTKLKILKLYHKKKSHNLRNSVKQIELHLAKISHIIYNYHINNKKILFIGFPKNIREILKKTKHSFIPEHQWFNGMLSNRNYTAKQKNLPNNIIKLFLKLRKKIDLIVVYNLNKSSTAIKEAYISRTPLILFSEKLDITNSFPTYESPGDFNIDYDKKTNSNLFFLIIKMTLKKAKRVIKKKNKKLQLKS